MGGLPRDARRGGGLGHAHAKEQVTPNSACVLRELVVVLRSLSDF